jgi:hypothetical protein
MNADASSRAGSIIAAVTGFGWSKTAGGIIAFQNQAINHLVIHQANDWARIIYSGQLINGNIGKFSLKAKTKGRFGNKEVIGVDINGNYSKTQGLSSLMVDNEFLDDILSVFKSKLVVYKDFMDSKNWIFREIKFNLLKNPFRFIGGSKEVFGLIQLGLSTDLKKIRENNVNYYDISLKCLRIMNKIVHHTEPIWK